MAVTNWYTLLLKYKECPFVSQTFGEDKDDRMRVESILDTFVVDHGTNQKHFRLLEGYVQWNEEQAVYNPFHEKPLYQYLKSFKDRETKVARTYADRLLSAITFFMIKTRWMFKKEDHFSKTP